MYVCVILFCYVPVCQCAGSTDEGEYRDEGGYLGRDYLDVGEEK
mgnify:CR=1 FL=1